MDSAPADSAFLGSSELFEKQPAEVLQAVFAQGRIVGLGPGETLFRQGDHGDSLYIVKSGVLEVLAARGEDAEPTTLAYLGVGEVVGELALLTGSPRSATARAPERAELFALDQPVFLDLMQTLPAFSRHLCVVLARRLEATSLKVPRAPAKQLQGNLRFFDLATVVQTLIGASQTGDLVVTEPGGKHRVAELFFYKGNIARAKYRYQLTGEDAVYQLFQSPLAGEFSFTGRAVQETDVQADIALPAVSLLMESVRQQDELPVLAERVGDPHRTLRANGSMLEWPDPDTAELAAAVWQRLKKGASPADLQHEIPRCTHAIYDTLVKLLDAGQVG